MYTTLKPHLLAVALLAGLNTVVLAGGFVHMCPEGSTPPNGDEGRPFGTIEAAVCHAALAGTPDTIFMAPGTYPDVTTINSNVTLTADPQSAPAVLGNVNDHNVSTMRVFTANTHLFGDECLDLLPTYADATRASVMFSEGFSELDADVVFLQEVWDPSLVNTIVAAAAGAGYQAYAGSAVEADCDLSCLSSGLLTLSKYPIQEGAQYAYAAQTGCDATVGSQEGNSTKGYTRVHIVKDGVPMYLYNTHTEADAGDHAVRLQQIQQLMGEIDFITGLHPDAAIIVGGDFNVAGMTSQANLSNCLDINDHGESCWEYHSNLAGWANVTELNDALRNAPCYYSTPINDLYTASLANPLHVYFSDGIPSEMLDYIFYSRPNTQSAVQPHLYVESASVYKMRKNTTLCADLCDPFCDVNICTQELSDHYGIVADFKILAPN